MAQPDISQILAALSGGTPVQTTGSAPPANPAYAPYAAPPPASYGLPQPMNSGSVDLSSIRPSHSGSVSLNDQNRGGGRGSYDDNRYGRDPRNRNMRSRSRSRSPQRGGRDSYGRNFNPYADERRDDRSRYRDRSFSPPQQNYPFQIIAGNGRDSASSGDSGTETLMVDSNLVGLIIGRAGENLRRVESETKSRVQFMAAGADGNTQQRICKITGTRAAREHAKQEIARIIHENQSSKGGGGGGGGRDDRGSSTSVDRTVKQPGSQQPALRTGEDSIQMMVPNRTVGLIIGRGGETIRDLQERSGCHVNIVGEDKSVNGLRPVNLIGTPQAAAIAKDLILEIVDSDNKGMGQNLQNMPAPRAGESGDKINDSITVPSEAVGMIIGKGGETIKDMQNVTGCKINVSQPSGRDIEREIGLIGTRSAIEHAKHVINDKVRAVEDKTKGKTGSDRGGSANETPYNASANTGSSSYGQNYTYGQQQQGYQAPTSTSAPPAAPAQGGDDPYAAYGGYENYVAMWQAYLRTSGQQGAGAPTS